MNRKVIREFHICSASESLIIEKKGSEDSKRFIDNIPSDVLLCAKQNFAWHPGYFACLAPAQIRGYYVKLFLGDQICVDPLSSFALVLPFSKTDEDQVQVSALSIIPFDLPSGNYQVLYEFRYIRPSELIDYADHEDFKSLLDNNSSRSENQDPSEDYFNCPGLCYFTFVPTTETIEPKILKGTPTDLSTPLTW